MNELAHNSELSAVVYGQNYTQFPEDLFIPPNALEVLLESFSGPLDLLLYLIRKQNIDILDIPIMTITTQYLSYIRVLFDLRDTRKLELAADYLLMATTLAEIKSKLLLPVAPSTDEEENDPRMELMKRLQEYEQIKNAAERMDRLPRQNRDTFSVQIDNNDLEVIINQPDIALEELVQAMNALLKKAACFTQHEISREQLSVRDRMRQILEQLQTHRLLELSALFTVEEGRRGLVVSFLAILELAKQSLINITQAHPYSTIYIQAACHG